jgi:hypothetical protein
MNRPVVGPCRWIEGFSALQTTVVGHAVSAVNRSMRRTRRIRQPHGEQRRFRLHPAQHHPQIVKVDLGLGGRRMGLRHVSQLQRPARIGQDLRATLADIITHRRIRQPHRVMLIHQPRQNPSRRVPLLARRIQVTAQHGIDRRLERRQPRRHPHSNLPRRRHGRLQRLAHRAPMHTVLIGQRPNRQSIDPVITPNRRELLHPRPHPPPHLRNQKSGLSRH